MGLFNCSNSVKFLLSTFKSSVSFSGRTINDIGSLPFNKHLYRALDSISKANNPCFVQRSYSTLHHRQSTYNSYNVKCCTSKYTSKHSYASKATPKNKSNVENEITKVLTEYNSLDPVTDAERVKQMKPLVSIINAINQVQSDMKSLDDLTSDKSEDKEMKTLLEDEMKAYKDQLEDLTHEFAEAIIQDEDQFEHCREVMMEVSGGVGGQEAMLFAQEVHGMYVGYAEHRGWECETAVMASTEAGGIRQATLHISGPDAFSFLKYEGGVHRVQRVPKTEKAGRVHTSTVCVAVLPQPRDIEVSIAEKDLKVETKRATGAGGQHVNTTDSAVRITHLPTGMVVECQEERHQIKNRAIAIAKLKRMIYETRFEEQETRSRVKRKVQVGRRTRNEKIRTYNYPQDRITDHRAQRTLYNISEFMRGGVVLHELIAEIRQHDYDYRIEQLLS